MNFVERKKCIKSFEEFINGKEQDDILLMLDKEYKQDKWSIVCSAMHWFNIVIPYLDSSKLLKDESQDFGWGEVYLYISAVDIVTKGINELYKFINNTDKHIFDGEKDVFGVNEDDNHHFQNIRAIFGAHSTSLKNNGEYIVSTFPTPYDKRIGALRGKPENWDYYTLLWSKNKSDSLIQKPFGFCFEKVDAYLDKYLLYLEEFYSIVLGKIAEYKKKMTEKKINIIEDSAKQINLLMIKDRERFNGKYNYQLETLYVLMTTTITDGENNKIYSDFRTAIKDTIPRLFDIIQKSKTDDNLDFVNDLIDCKSSTKYEMYYYSKLMEYESNDNLKDLLLNYFSDKIAPFNSNVESLQELFCLVKAVCFFNDNIQF